MKHFLYNSTRFFIKPLYQPSPNAVPVLPFENDKFIPDDTKIFSIDMGSIGKAKKDNVLKPNGISGPGQYRIQFHFFLLFSNIRNILIQ